MYDERLYPYCEQMPKTNHVLHPRWIAKLCTRDGRVVRAFKGTRAQTWAVAGAWFVLHHDQHEDCAPVVVKRKRRKAT